MSHALPSPRFAPPTGLGRPPLPREHGAWVMLLTPLVVGLASSPSAALPAGLLAIAAVCAFLAQNAAGVLLKPRAPRNTAAWLGLFAGAMAASGLALVAGFDRWALLWLALPALGLFGLHLRLLKGPAAARLDRTVWGGLLAAGALTLTGPAALVVARGTLDAPAAGLWLASVAAFASGIVHVNMRLEAVKVREAFTAATRWRLGRGLVLFHAGLAIALVAAAVCVPGPAGWMALVAFAPLIARAAWAFARLEKGVPSFKAIGIRETVLTTWFALWAIALLRVLG
jgi:hypothetical protein